MDSGSANQQPALDRLPTLATDDLMSLMYDELRRLAARRLSSYPVGTLTATALVHEAYLRLAECKELPQWNSRAHFFCAAAEGMRRILVDEARRKRSQKRGGHFRRTELMELPDPETNASGEELLALDEALTQLECADQEAATLVSLRYFADLTIPEAAEALDISPRTADRIWAYARAWLYDRLHP